MAGATIKGVAVRGVVCAVPGEPVSVYESGRAFATADIDQVAKTVGLKETYRAAPGQTAGDLCLAAAEALLADLGWERESVDGLILVTQNPDHFSPATACIVHGKLGLADRCVAFDVGMGCSGYVYGLWMSSQFVAAGTCKRILLLAGDTPSQAISSEDKSVAMLFGDAGSATACEDGSRRSPFELQMDGLAIFNFTLKRVPALVRDTLAQAGWDADAADAYLFHQANGFILGKIAKKLGLDPDRVPVNIDRYGNTSMASVPLLIVDDVADRVRSPEGVRVVMAGFGVGYSWAGAALTLQGLESARLVHV
jgi:3-oxoacyl-[acyl-carrier-protein] synthase-3